MTTEINFTETITKINENKYPFETKLIHQDRKDGISEIELWPGDVFDISQSTATEIIEKLTVKNDFIEFVFREVFTFEDTKDYKLFLHEKRKEK